MGSNSTFASTPLTFELPQTLVDEIHSWRSRRGLKSVSEVVRHALAQFDFAAFRALRQEQCQLSVRLSEVQRQILFQHARRKKVSAGVLLRSAIETLLPHPAGAGAVRPQQPNKNTMAKKTAKKSVRKKTAKKKKR